MGVPEDLERLGRLLDAGKLTPEEFESAKAALLAGGTSDASSAIGSSKPPAGWYPDPHGRTGLSAWWNGEEWTGATQPTQSAATPVIVQQTKKSGGCLRAVLIIGFGMVVLAYCFGSNLGDPTTGINNDLNLDLDPSCSVVYSIGGTASSASLTLTNASGNTEQVESVTIPYQRTLTIPCGDFVYISAQNNGESGSVTCRITSDGASIETAESSGAYVIATCSGTA